MSVTSERMIAAAPTYYEGSAIFAEIQEAQAGEFESVEAKNEDLRNQLYITTATWGLDYWEKTLRIKTITTDSYEIRRSRVLSAWRSRGQFSANLIKSICESYTNGTVDVTINLALQKVVITFSGSAGVPPNMTDLQYTVENIVHAHLGTDYVFMWSLWNKLDAANKTYTQLDTYTWDQLEISFIN